MQIAKMKFKHASQTTYQQIYSKIIDVSLQYLELNHKFPNNNENFRKIKLNYENLYVKFWNLKININYLKLRIQTE